MERDSITKSYYPYKIDINKFENIIVDNFINFKSNMNSLGEEILEEKYIEDWMDIYLRWSEIHKKIDK